MNKAFFQRIPVPLSGVMLSLAAFGNFIRASVPALWVICEVLAAAIFVLLILKAIICAEDIRAALTNPVGSGIICTFSMGSLFLSVSVNAVSHIAALVLWICATSLHVYFIINYTKRFALHFKRENLFTVSFLVYVGIAAAAATSPAFGLGRLGTALLIFATAAMLILFPLNIVRYSTLPSPGPLRPLICIFAAPLSLCLVAYLSVAAKKNAPLVLAAVAVTIGLFVFALIQAIRCIRWMAFAPTFSAFTFPFVNSAIAAFQSAATLKAAGFVQISAVLSVIAPIEMIIAVTLLAFVAVCYARAIFAAPQQTAEQAAN